MLVRLLGGVRRVLVFVRACAGMCHVASAASGHRGYQMEPHLRAIARRESSTTTGVDATEDAAAHQGSKSRAACRATATIHSP